MDESSSENESIEESPFELGAEEIISQSLKPVKFQRFCYSGHKPDESGGTQIVGNGAKLRKKRKGRFQLIRCNHENPVHFSRAYVESALKSNDIAIMMNSLSAYSVVWSFCGFPEIDNEVCTAWVICTVCRSVFSYLNATTSGAKRHVISKHVPNSESVENAALMARLERAQAVNSMMKLKNEDEPIQEDVPLHDLGESQVRIIFDDDYDQARTNCVRQKRRFTNRRNSHVAPNVVSPVTCRELQPAPPHVTVSTPTGQRSAPSTKCTLCNVDFNNAALAMMHQSCHASTKKFDCAHCKTLFPNVFDFWAHLYSRECQTSKN